MAKKAPSLINKQVGKYQILNEISRGGMGVIFLGKHVTLNRYAAIKMLFPHLAGELNFVKRFREEMHAMAELQHPNIVDIYDYEEDHNTYFIIMEVVIGRSLDSMLKEAGKLDSRAGLGICRQVLQALDCAHTKGILHRDVKPTNIMINDSGSVKVLDFGIAKILGGQKLTRTGFMVGTPQYISPEQADGKELSPASDLYSVSVVLFEMLTGRPPFMADTPMGVMMAHLKDPPPKPRKLIPDIPASVEKFILKGLEKNPSNRFQTAKEMIVQLEKLTSLSEKSAEQQKNAVKKMFRQTAPTLIDSDAVNSSDATLAVPKAHTEDAKTPTGMSRIRYPGLLSRFSMKNVIGISILLIISSIIAWLSVTSKGKAISSVAWNSVKEIFVKPETTNIPLQKSYFAIPQNPLKAYGNVIGIEFEVIPHCSFTMGVKPGTTGSLDDSPDHEVKLDRYLIGKYEVTNAQYKMFLDDTGYPAPSGWQNGTFTPGQDRLPVVNVTWVDSIQFCRWLSQKTGLIFRLPTEAEWERSAYSGTTFPWGDRWRDDSSNTAESGNNRPRQVGSFSSDRSLAGIFDMGGNVREWVLDNYSMSAYAVSVRENPTGPDRSNKRVIRGGAFNLPSKSSRTTKRDSLDPKSSRDNLGFRIVLVDQGIKQSSST